MTSNEARLYAELFLDLKSGRKKRLDWISIAQKCKTLADSHRSYSELAGKLGVSTTLLRGIVSLLDLPAEVQEMVRKGEILFDAAHRLNTLKDAKQKVRVARAVRGLPSHRQREIIQFAKRVPDGDLASFTKRATESKPPAEKVHVFVFRISEQQLEALRRRAASEGIQVQGLVTRAIDKLLGAKAEP